MSTTFSRRRSTSCCFASSLEMSSRRLSLFVSLARMKHDRLHRSTARRAARGCPGRRTMVASGAACGDANAAACGGRAASTTSVKLNATLPNVTASPSEMVVLGDATAVHERSVARPEIPHRNAVVRVNQFGVTSRYRGIVDGQVRRYRPADDDRLARTDVDGMLAGRALEFEGCQRIAPEADNMAG